jgi:hypothetical protein
LRPRSALKEFQVAVAALHGALISRTIASFPKAWLFRLVST